MDTKICRICGKEKWIDSYYIRNNGVHRNECKKCQIKLSKSNRLNKIEQFRKRDREYEKAHREERNAYRNNKLKTNESFKIYDSIREAFNGLIAGRYKHSKYLDILGYNKEDLLNHL